MDSRHPTQLLRCILKSDTRINIYPSTLATFHIKFIYFLRKYLCVNLFYFKPKKITSNLIKFTRKLMNISNHVQMRNIIIFFFFYIFLISKGNFTKQSWLVKKFFSPTLNMSASTETFHKPQKQIFSKLFFFFLMRYFFILVLYAAYKITRYESVKGDCL